MPLPVTKQELADWILRRLGAPVINVEITDVQLEDVIDEAVQFFQEYHYDGAERAYRVIKIEGDVLNGNNRRPQALTAPMWESDKSEYYRIGDRVMTYNNAGRPDRIWIKYDSEERVNFVIYTRNDSEGDYFAWDSDLPDDLIAILDANARDHIDSDSGYRLYDSDNHNSFIYTLSTIELTTRPLPEGTIPVDGQILFVDSDGTRVRYDSDEHVVVIYDSDDNGLYVDSDNVKVVYDSDKHILVGYELVVDSDLVDTFYVDSDGTFVLFDSDKHGIITTYVSDPTGLYVREEGSDRYVLASIDPLYATSPKFSPLYNRPDLYSKAAVQPQRFRAQNDYPLLWIQVDHHSWVDSEGEFVLYDSEKHDIQRYDSDVNGVWVDSDNRRIDSEGNSTIVAYDSDVHVNIFYDSDVNGIYVYNDSENFYDSDDLSDSDSDRTWILFDSDRDTRAEFDSDSDNGTWIDSDGVYVLYNSDKHDTRVYDSDSDFGNIQAIDTTPIYVQDSEDNFVLYDSDVHGPDSDSDDYPQLFRLTKIKFDGDYFTRRLVQPTKYTKRSVPFQRFNREVVTERYLRNQVLQGRRYVQTMSPNQPRRTDYGWNDLWKHEQLVLTEPTVDYDYSKVGQVGIQIPENIIGISKVFRIDNFSGTGMYNYEYQYFLNNFDMFYGSAGQSSGAMSNYYATRQYIELIDTMMNVQPAIRFNKARNRLYIDTNWSRLNNQAGSKSFFLMVECYEANDPEVYGDVYKDKWLKRYATAQAKMQWGSNLKKYQNTELPGGIQLSGQELYDEGKEEAKELEEELKTSQLEMDFLVG